MQRQGSPKRKKYLLRALLIFENGSVARHCFVKTSNQFHLVTGCRVAYKFEETSPLNVTFSGHSVLCFFCSWMEQQPIFVSLPAEHIPFWKVSWFSPPDTGGRFTLTFSGVPFSECIIIVTCSNHNQGKLFFNMRSPSLSTRGTYM